MVAPLDASGLQRLELGAEVAEDGGGAAQEENNGVELQFEKKGGLGFSLFVNESAVHVTVGCNDS